MIDSRAYSEVNEIIKKMTQSMQSKIPEELKKAIESNSDLNYVINKENISQGIFLKDTEKILSVIYTDYLSTEIERKAIYAKERKLEYQKEVEKRKKYYGM